VIDTTETRLETGPVQQAFERDMLLRTGSFLRMRTVAQHIEPGLFPETSVASNQNFMEQAVNPLGAEVHGFLRGHLLSTMYPATEPLLRLELDGDATATDGVDEATLLAAQSLLTRQASVLNDTLQSQQVFSSDGRRWGMGFRQAKALAIDLATVLGECCQYVTSDLRLHVFRPDQYAPVYDAMGTLVRLTVRRVIDPSTLTEDQRQRARLPESVLNPPEQNAVPRNVGMYTRYEFKGGKWEATDEINGRTVSTAKHSNARYFVTHWRLRPGEQVGRSHYEPHLARLNRYLIIDRALEACVLADADVKIGISSQSTLTPRQIAENQILYGVIATANGTIGDIATMSIDKSRSVQILAGERRALENEFRALMGVPDFSSKERTTREQIIREHEKFNAVSGGAATGFIDSDVSQTMLAVMDAAIEGGVIEKPQDAGIAAVLDKYRNVRSITGLASLAKGQQLNTLLTMAQVLSTPISPESGINPRRFTAKVVATLGNFADVMTTDAERNAQAREQIALTAGQQAATSAVDVGAQAALANLGLS
jgi:hypothetical protein